MSQVVPAIRRRFTGLLAIALAATGSAHAGSQRVDVGGYRLYLRCTGAGAPTVVLDAGAGDTSGTWDWVVPEVRRFARVCAYDRAGLGRSEPGPLPRSSSQIVTELEELLRRARVPGPYVLVGHSFGGLNMRLFAARRPDDVAGLVLVDATPEDYVGREGVFLSAADREKLLTARGGAPAAFRAELDAMAESAETVRRMPAPRMRVIVLSASHPGDPAAYRALWTDLQKRMLDGFPDARQVVADASDHYVQFDQPELVVDAIRELVNEARPTAQAHGR